MLLVKIDYPHYFCKNTKTINSKIIAPMWNDELELPDGSYSASDSQDYFEYTIKKSTKH